MSELATPPAAPAAPAPAPAAPSAPAPAPAPAPPAPGGEPNPFADIDAAFIKAEGALPTQPLETKPPKEGTKEPKGGTKPPESGTKDPKTGQFVKGTARPEPALLRQELEKNKAELTTWQTRAQELERKISEFEAKGKDTEALTTRLQSLEKEIEKRDAELYAANEELRPSFKQTYEKPFDDAAEYAVDLVKQMTIMDEEGNPVRQGTFEDIHALYKMGPGQAADEAVKMFGQNRATLILTQLDKMFQLNRNRLQALKVARETAAVRMKEEQGRTAQQNEEYAILYDQVGKEIEQKIEGYRDPIEDKELVEARQKGYRIFDNPTRTPREQIVKNAHIRQRTAAFVPNQITIKRLRAEVAELKAKLEGQSDPTPGQTRRGGGTTEAAPAPEDWAEGLRKAVDA